MFQTEILIWIQSHASGFWTAFFKFWSAYTEWVIPLMLLILFAVSLRAGFVLIQAVFWNMTIVIFLKELILLPRPSSVDSNVQLLGKGIPNPSPYESGGAKSFFGKLPHDVVQGIRAHPFDTWGLPSGHTSSSVTFAGLVYLLVKNRWVRIAAAVMIILIPLSRLYLGRHFLADLLAGYLFALVFVLAFYHGIYQRRWFRDFFYSRWDQTPWDVKTWAILFYLVVLPFLVLLIPFAQIKAVSALLGLNLGYILLRIKGVPQESGTVIQRAARAGIALVFYFGMDLLLRGVEGFFSSSGSDIVLFAHNVLVMMLMFWASTEVSVRLGLFKRAS
ncbi:MAG: phosphatase PAP2 family protein [Candidatus Aminicenantaceae bacterium]